MAQISIRQLEASDRSAWDVLWQGYLDFYRVSLPQAVTEITWQRLMGGALIGRVALGEGLVVGITHAVLHQGTWSAKPVCYLEDLFVAPAARCRGVARALIEMLADERRREGWHRIYWQTAGDNHKAQAVYDRLGKRTNWIRYDLDL